jgi:prephenate dehydrogenase
MMADILKTNRLQVLSVLAQFSKQLDLVRVLLENQNFDNLTELLTTGKEQHQDIITKEHLSS